jgi:hypothetical protein
MAFHLRAALRAGDMNSLSRRTIVSLVAGVLLLLGLNLWMAPKVALRASPTSFGVERQGYKAAYDLLLELGVPVSRSYVRPGAIPADRSLWLVSPSFLNGDLRDDDATGGGLLRWVRAGGTAVVFGDPESDWKRLNIERGVGVSDAANLIEGDFAPRARKLDVTELVHFTAAHEKTDHKKTADDKTVDDQAARGKARVRLTCGGAPFALEIPLGAGRLVAIADGRFLRNANLGSGDASVLLVDLVRALGPPMFDEYFHGLVESGSLVATLAGSRVILALGAGLLLALLWVGEQRSWPPRRLAERAEEPAPSIASFLDSLGVLYARARDPGAAFRAYRAGFLVRVRRQLWPHGEFSEQFLLERLERDRSLLPETRHWLIDGATPANESELVSAVRAIESYPGIGTGIG